MKAAAAAAVFAVLLAGFSYFQFERQVVLYKANSSGGEAHPILEFEVKPGPPANLWTVEIERSGGSGPGSTARILLNGAAIGGLSGSRSKWTLEFPAAALRAGRNVLSIEAPESWRCGRVSLRNVVGYASGVFAAVVVAKANLYPGLRTWSSSALAAISSVLLIALVFLLALAAEHGGPPASRVLKFLRGSRNLVLGSAAIIVVLPLVSRYRLLLALPTALLWPAFYCGLSAIAAFPAALRRAVRGLRMLGRRGAAAFRRSSFGRTAAGRWSALLLAVFVVIVLSVPGPGPIMGDGIEYYAMMTSLARFGTPYLTPESCAALDSWVGRPASAPGETTWAWIHRNLQTLDENRRADLTHFWFYPLLAAVFAWPVKLAGLPPGICFSLLHIVLLGVVFFAVRRALGDRAGLSLLLIVFGSPLLWFVNKGQVEFFTVLLALAGAAWLAAENFAASALAFAVASTQNPPFAALAGLVFILGGLKNKARSLRTSFPLWAAAGFLAVLQPAYYFFRHGVVNPVLATGAAKMGGDPLAAKKAEAIFIDPDIGLFPNWPVALVVLIGFGILAARRRTSLKPALWIFLPLSAAVLLWSQAKTQNMNHGGTLNISRYALWYLYIFFLALWRILEDCSRRSAAVRRVCGGAGVALGLAFLAINWPARPETYLQPTRLSRFLYERWPRLYDPLPEVFFERIRGEEGAPPPEIWAVSTRSGSKIFVFANRIWFRKDSEVLPIPSCPELDPVLVFHDAKRLFEREPDRDYVYFNGMGGRFRRR